MILWRTLLRVAYALARAQQDRREADAYRRYAPYE